MNDTVEQQQLINKLLLLMMMVLCFRFCCSCAFVCECVCIWMLPFVISLIYFFFLHFDVRYRQTILFLFFVITKHRLNGAREIGFWASNTKLSIVIQMNSYRQYSLLQCPYCNLIFVDRIFYFLSVKFPAFEFCGFDIFPILGFWIKRFRW